MDWGALLKQLIPLGISIAESVHPLPNSGAQKLATATTFVQMGLGLASAAGAIPPKVATSINDVTQAINQQVAVDNAKQGVAKIGRGPSTIPQ